MNSLGSKERPCSSVKDIKKCLRSDISGRIYVKKIFELPIDIVFALCERDIKLWVVSVK